MTSKIFRKRFAGSRSVAARHGIERDDRGACIAADGGKNEDAQTRNHPQIGITDSEHIPKSNVCEIDGIGLDRADERDSERKGCGEQDADSRVLFDIAPACEKANPSATATAATSAPMRILPSECRRWQRREVLRETWRRRGMPSRASHIAADHRAEDAHHKRGEQTALHKAVRKGIGEKLDHDGTRSLSSNQIGRCPPKVCSSGGQHWSTIKWSPTA